MADDESGGGQNWDLLGPGENFGRNKNPVRYSKKGEVLRDAEPRIRTATGQESASFPEWEVVEELDLSKRGEWLIFLAYLVRIFNYRGKKYSAEELGNKRKLLKEVSIFLGFWPIKLYQLRDNIRYWIDAAGCVFRRSTRRQSAMAAYKPLGGKTILILRELPLCQILHDGSKQTLVQTAEVDRFKIAQLGWIENEKRSYMFFKEAMDKSAREAGINPEHAIMVLGSTPHIDAEEGEDIWLWEETEVSRVEEADWERVNEIWLKSDPDPEVRPELLFIFALDKRYFDVQPVAPFLTGIV